MTEKTVIVTGCTSGIGRETARELVRKGCRVIMACRNLELAEALRDEFIRETGNDKIVIRKLDVSSLKSVRAFAEVINREEKKLDVLIHNAGIAGIHRKKLSENGLELTMATNHFGPFLLTHLLIDLLKQSAPSRIVVVASIMHHFAYFNNFNNPNPTSYIPVYLYCLSKRANIAFTLELARRLKGTGVTANCLHPGFVRTNIERHFPAICLIGWKLGRLTFFKTVEQGAETTIYLAVSDQVEGVSGKYFADCREAWLARRTKDPGVGKRLWEMSEVSCQLKNTDPKI